MRNIDEYEYDLFISWTGKDRALKNAVKEYFRNKYGDQFKIYDSDVDCKGNFRENFGKALLKSKVYLVILSDHLRRTEHITEVTRECDMACDLEANGELNIVVLCVSDYFRQPCKDCNDKLGWYFYTAFSAHSQIFGEYVDGTLSDNTYEKLDKDVIEFIREREAGQPAIPQKPHYDVKFSRLPRDDAFKGRGEQLGEIFEAFQSGARIVVLSGIGGIGKTKLAEEFAREAEKANLFRCLQIVHVRELTQERSALKILVSEVTYENSFYCDISKLNQNDQYRCKLNALKQLPEYALLVFDNFNAANPYALKEILDSLKCRVLVTTRADLREEEFEKDVKLVTVPRIPYEIARDIFKDTSKREVPEERFKVLYDMIDGHTITLCIIGKILCAHPELSFEELINGITDIENLPQSVEFEHNAGFGGINDDDTIFGHLRKLFNLSDLSEECKNILGNISLISDGRISFNDIRSAMRLITDNSLNTLVKNGWLEQYTDGNGQRSLYLHPVISQLAFNLIKPDQKSAGGIIEYLCGLYDGMRDNLLYSNAHIMEDKLFYCIYRLSITDANLNTALWERFAELSHLLGEIDNLQKKRDILTRHLGDSADVKKVTSHYDMIAIEQNPIDFALIEKYIDNLQYNAEDYKWVLRSLSVALKHVGMHPDYKKLIKGTIGKAIAVAEDKRDDLGITVLGVDYLFADPKEASENLKKYLKLRRSEKANNGYLVYIKAILNGVKAYGGIEKYLMQSFALINNAEAFASKSNLSYIIDMLRHPVIAHRNNSVYKSIVNLPSDDPFSFYFEAIMGLTISIIYHEKVDAQGLFNMAVELYRLYYENGMTLAPLQDSVAYIISLIKSLPEEMQGELKKISSIFYNPQDITIGEMSQLQVACLINSEFNDDQAIRQSELLLNIVKKWHASNYNAIVEAIIRHGNVYVTFKRDKEALKLFLEAYSILKEKAKDSVQLAELCKTMLNNEAVVDQPLETLRKIRDTALSIYKERGERCLVLSAYANRIVDVYKKQFAKNVTLNIKNKELIHSYILQSIPKYVSDMLLPHFGKSEDSRDFTERLNKFLSETVYTKECKLKLILTPEIIGQLSADELCDLVSELVERAYKDKFEDKTTETFQRFEQDCFTEAIEKTVVEMRGGEKAFAVFPKFKENIIRIALSKLLAARVTVYAGRKKNTDRSEEEIPIREIDSETVGQILEKKQKKKNDFNFFELSLLEIWRIERVWNRELAASELKIAVDEVLSLARNFKSYDGYWQESILSGLFAIYERTVALNIDSDYPQKFIECYKLMMKKAAGNTAKKALVCYYRAQADLFRNDKKKACDLYRRAVRTCLKYNVNLNYNLSNNIFKLISISAEFISKNGGAEAFIRNLAGKNQKCFNEASERIKALLQTKPYDKPEDNGNGVTEGERIFINVLYRTLLNIYPDFKITAMERMKIMRSVFNRTNKYIALVLNNALQIMENGVTKA